MSEVSNPKDALPAEPTALTAQAQAAAQSVLDGANTLADHIIDAGVGSIGAALDALVQANEAIGRSLKTVIDLVLNAQDGPSRPPS